MINDITSICKGYSHEASGKPCQDFVYSESTPELSMAIVSDGHGGERYFRSDKGSQFVVEIAAQSIRTFVSAMSSREASVAKEYGDTPLFEGMPLTQYSEATPSVFAPGKERQGKYIHRALTGLFRSILTQWNMFITEKPLCWTVGGCHIIPCCYIITFATFMKTFLIFYHKDINLF